MTRAKKRASASNSPKVAAALAGLEDGTYANPYQAYKATGAPVQTLYHRLKGGKSRREANIESQALTPAEESALVNYAQRASAVGHPIRHDFLRELAEEIRKRRALAEGKILNPLGVKWVQRFLARHPELQSRISKSMEAARLQVTKEQILEWYETFKRVTQDIKPENIYNMDETGSH
jgi:hypothetical protein